MYIYLDQRQRKGCRSGEEAFSRLLPAATNSFLEFLTFKKQKKRETHTTVDSLISDKAIA